MTSHVIIMNRIIHKNKQCVNVNKNITEKYIEESMRITIAIYYVDGLWVKSQSSFNEHALKLVINSHF